jgi:hypothetical protein
VRRFDGVELGYAQSPKAGAHNQPVQSSLHSVVDILFPTLISFINKSRVPPSFGRSLIRADRYVIPKRHRVFGSYVNDIRG